MRPVRIPFSARWRWAPWALVALGLCRCSLSLENPEEDAKKKLQKIFPTSMQALDGQWIADSTYTLLDTRATRLDAGLRLEFFPDSSLKAVDDSRLVFPVPLASRLSLLGDTLVVMRPSGGGIDSFVVKLRFLGNYLELINLAEQRFTYFHKHKRPDTTAWRVLLADSLWRLQGLRTAPDTFLAETFQRDFTYLHFSGDSLYWDERRNGVARLRAGPLRFSGRSWSWILPDGELEFQGDLIQADSLRIWPRHEKGLDSGYQLFRRTGKIHPLDPDLDGYLDYWRSDSLNGAAFGRMENHYGRFYDLVLGRDHGVKVLTNMAWMPRFQSWSIDSGTLVLDSAGAPRTRPARFKVEKRGPNTWRLAGDSSWAFPRGISLYQTRVDGSNFSKEPLTRFDQASYVQLLSGTDSLFFYYWSNYRQATLQEHEIARAAGPDTLWLAMRINPSAETFLSSQAGFLFAFQGKTASGARYTCKAVPERDLTLRSTPGPDPLMAQGIIQGSCRVAPAGAMPESTLAVTGTFKLRRKPEGNLGAPFWNQP